MYRYVLITIHIRVLIIDFYYIFLDENAFPVWWIYTYIAVFVLEKYIRTTF